MLHTPDWDALRIPSHAIRLDNGLTIIAHQDCRAPLVTVFVAYRAGAREEPAGKYGLAHICEHLMYCGTGNNPGSFFQPLEEAGGASINAFIHEDYSAYFATLPRDAFGYALQLEADRMANLAEALSAEKLQRQREVVRNELFERAITPDGEMPGLIAKAAHPVGHPYAHPPDGLVEMLDSITLDDAQLWIRSRHAPGSAALVITGDIDVRIATEKAAFRFGAIRDADPGQSAKIETTGFFRSGGLISRPGKASRVSLIWPGSPARDPLAVAPELFCEVLSDPDSAFRKSLANDAEPGCEVSCELRLRELGSLVILTATSSRCPAADLRYALTRALEAALLRGIDERDWSRARMRWWVKQLRALERTGGKTGKAAALGRAYYLTGDAHDERIRALADCDATVAQRELRRLFSSDYSIIEFSPDTPRGAG